MAIANAAPLIPRRPLSLDEFFALDVVLAELVDGQPILMSAPGVLHQRVVGSLSRMLHDACPAGFEVITAPVDWVLWQLPKPTVRQPDLAVVRYRPGDRPRLTEPPLLVVEVVSPSSQERDLVAKRRDYARAGAEHYWLVDPNVPLVVCLQGATDGDGYDEVARLLPGVTTRVSRPFAVAIDPADLNRSGP